MSPAQVAAIQAWTRAQVQCRNRYARERAIEEASPDEAKQIRKASRAEYDRKRYLERTKT